MESEVTGPPAFQTHGQPGEQAVVQRRIDRGSDAR
jgi:hypothetical protein